MAENAREVSESLCKNCAFLVQFVVKNDNMWWSDCMKRGTVKPTQVCGYYLED